MIAMWKGGFSSSSLYRGWEFLLGRLWGQDKAEDAILSPGLTGGATCASSLPHPQHWIALVILIEIPG